MKKRVLIVGGEAQWLASIQRYFAHHATLDVLTASDAAAAQSLLTSGQLDVIIMDVACKDARVTLREVGRAFPSCLLVASGGAEPQVVLPSQWEPQALLTTLALVEHRRGGPGQQRRAPHRLPPPLPKAKPQWQFVGSSPSFHVAKPVAPMKAAAPAWPRSPPT